MRIETFLTILRQYSRENPFLATISSAKRLTSPDAVKEVLHIELDVSEASQAFSEMMPGDAIGVVAVNPKELVDGVLARLNVADPNQRVTLETTTAGGVHFQVFPSESLEELPIHLKGAFTLRELFTSRLDLTSMPKRNLLRILAEYASVESEKQDLMSLCSIKGPVADILSVMTFLDRKLYQEQIEQGLPSLLDLLYRYPSSFPPLDHLVGNMLPLSPRFYSLCNSLKVHPNTLHVAFTIVETNIEKEPYARVIRGICSHWMKIVCWSTCSTYSRPQLIESAQLVPPLSTDVGSLAKTLEALSIDDKAGYKVPKEPFAWLTPCRRRYLFSQGLVLILLLDSPALYKHL